MKVAIGLPEGFFRPARDMEFGMLNSLYSEVSRTNIVDQLVVDKGTTEESKKALIQALMPHKAAL